MTDYDIHSCGYYCDRHACIVAQRNELRDKLFGEQWVKTYSGGKPNYTQPIGEEHMTDDEQKWVDTNNTTCAMLRQLHDSIALSSLPPQREWQGLTDEETNALIRKWAGELVFEVTQVLKKKNNE